MRNNLILFLLTTLAFNCLAQESFKSVDRDIDAINQTIQEWDRAWELKDLELALKHYALKNRLDECVRRSSTIKGRT